MHTHGGKVPIQFVIGTSGWAMFVHYPLGAFDLGGNRPRAIALIVRDILKRGAAQPASRRKKRDRLNTVGLSGAVRTHQHDHIAPRLKARRAIVAEVRKREAVNAGSGHG